MTARRTSRATLARRERQARAAAAAGRRAAGALGKAVGAPAAPGDLFVLREAAGLAVEWLAVERDPADRERLFIVPADTNPLLGGNDWALAVDGATGPLSLRCGFGLWLPSWRLAPELRVGSVAPASLAQAALRCGAVRGGAGTGAGEGEGEGEGDAEAELAGAARWSAADADPEYEDWLDEVIAPACAALVAAATPATPATAAAAVVGAVPAADSSPVQPDSRRGRLPATRRPGKVRRRLYWMALAASLLLALALALGLGGALSRQTRLAQRLRAERDALQAGMRQQALPAAVPPRPAQALALAAGAAAEDDVLVNLPLVALQPEVLRGRSEKIRLDAAPRRFLLLAAEPRRGSSFPAYRLEIRDLRTGRRVWSGSGLHLDPSSGLVTIGIRQRLLPAGVYEIRLDGLSGGRADLAGSYSLEVETGDRPPASPDH